MIFDFNFESSAVNRSNSAVERSIDRGAALQLPLSISGELLNLSAVKPSAPDAMAHFAPLNLVWHCDTDPVRGGARCLGLLSESEAGGVWALLILEHASTGVHQHNQGGAYGECVITLGGELEDTLDDGTAVTLRTGAVMFHAQHTIHEAIAENFWVGLFHQPAGSTELNECV